MERLSLLLYAVMAYFQVRSHSTNLPVLAARALTS
jgi:hypothetical protein